MGITLLQEKKFKQTEKYIITGWMNFPYSKE